MPNCDCWKRIDELEKEVASQKHSYKLLAEHYQVAAALLAKKDDALRKIVDRKCFDVPIHGKSFVHCICTRLGAEAALSPTPKEDL